MIESRGEACEVRTVDVGRVVRGRELLLGDDVYFELAETFRALADSSRAKIISSLLQQELCVCDLAAVVGMSESAVSQHLRVLRNLRLVKTRRDGKLVYYSLDDAHVRDLLDVSLSHLTDRGRVGLSLTSRAPGGRVADKPRRAMKKPLGALVSDASPFPEGKGAASPLPSRGRGPGG